MRWVVGILRGLSLENIEMGCRDRVVDVLQQQLAHFLFISVEEWETGTRERKQNCK